MINQKRFLDAQIPQYWVQVAGAGLLIAAIAMPVVFLLQNPPQPAQYGSLRPEMRLLPVDNSVQAEVVPFEVSVTEITQEQYQLVMRTNPSRFHGQNLPVENVSYIEAVQYCNRLSRLEGLQPYYDITEDYLEGNTANHKHSDHIERNGYRLPTLAEWGWITNTRGDGTNALKTITSAHGTHPVESDKPEKFDLFGLSGNVSEWVFSTRNQMVSLRSSSELVTRPFYQTYGTAGPNEEPIVVSGNATFDIESLNPLVVVRGGNWKGQGFNNRFLNSDYRSNTIGFRIARTHL